MSTRAIVGLSTIVVLLVVGYLLFKPDSSGEITYRFGVVDVGEVVPAISATGTLNAVTTVQVGSQVSGTISHLYADFNSQVEKNQLLAQLDPTFLQATVSEQRASRERAEAQVAEAQRNYDRAEQLFSRNLIAAAERDATLTALESARASLKQAVAALQRAEVNLRYATIRAPISGVVISRDVDVGQTVAASLSAPTLFTIAQDLTVMQVEASVDEADIGTVKVGQQVTFRVDSYPEDEFEGQVSQIRLSPLNTQGVVTYTVIIDVANPDLKLMPGMTANVTIESARKDDVVRVPIQAIRFTPSTVEPAGEQRRQPSGQVRAQTPERPRGEVPGREARKARKVRVWQLQSGKPNPVPVEIGLQDSRFAEVISGLQAADSVIIGESGGAATQSSTPGTSPFTPRVPGGGRRGF